MTVSPATTPHASQMPPLDLTDAHVRDWWGLLPRDLKSAFGDEVPPGREDEYRGFSEQMAAATKRSYADVIWGHADLVAAMGRPRRVRLLAWVVQRCWPESDKVVSLLTDVREGDGEASGAAGGDGRGKIAPLFLSDLESLAGRVIDRGARAMADRGTVRAVESGLRDFEDAFGPQTSGGF